MRKSIFLLLLTFMFFVVYSQVPEAFNYQAVVRDASGDIVPNTNVSFRISILQGSEYGETVYSEEHNATTNGFGLVTLAIGTGDPLHGIFMPGGWGIDKHFIKVEIDLEGGSSYVDMGTMQLLSVPYAFHAQTVEEDMVDDADADPANELQSISISNDQLTLSNGGGTVTLPSSGGDGDITSVIAGTGLDGGGTSGDVTLEVEVPLHLTSSENEVIKGTHSSGNYGALGTEDFGVFAIGYSGGYFEGSTDGVVGISSSSVLNPGNGGFFVSENGNGVHGIGDYAGVMGDAHIYGGRFGGSTGVRGVGSEIGGQFYSKYGIGVDAYSEKQGSTFIAKDDDAVAVWGVIGSSEYVKDPEELPQSYGGYFRSIAYEDGTGIKGEGSKYGVVGSGGVCDFYANGPGTNYGTPSSIRWKNNIVAIDNPLRRLNAIRGVYFDWDEDHGGRHDVGMIAEEVGKVMPEVVVYEENGVDASGMDYSKITPLLVEACKALKEELDIVKRELSQLKQEMANN